MRCTTQPRGGGKTQIKERFLVQVAIVRRVVEGCRAIGGLDACCRRLSQHTDRKLNQQKRVVRSVGVVRVVHLLTGTRPVHCILRVAVVVARPGLVPLLWWRHLGNP